MHRLFPPSWVLVVLWALPWAGFGQASDSEPWTLQQCLEHAQTNNLDLKQAELGLARGEAGLLAAQGAFLPNLNAQSSYGVNIGQRIDPLTNTFASDPVQSGNLGLSSSITLFNGMQNQINLKRAKLGMDLAATNAEVVQNNLALRVASSYLSVLFQRSSSPSPKPTPTPPTDRWTGSKSWSMPVRQRKATCWTSWPSGRQTSAPWFRPKTRFNSPS